MLKFGNGFVHFHIHKMHYRSFRTWNQSLIFVGKQTDVVDRVVDDTFNLSNRHFPLSHWVNSHTAVRMTRINYRLDCVCCDVFDTLSTCYWDQVRCFLDFPNLYLFVLGSTCTFLSRTWPCYTVNLISMPDKWM